MSSTRNLRGAVAAAVGAALLLVGAACNPPAPAPSDNGSGELLPIDQIIEAAKAEGTFTIYTATPEATMKVFTDAFEAKYGIKAEVVRLGGTELLQRFVSEAESGVVRADVFSTSDPKFIAENPQYFVKLDPGVVPNTDNFPEWARTDTSFLWSANPFVVQYNTDLLPESQVPSTWEDFLKPEYRGMIMLNDPRQGNNARAWLQTMVDMYGEEYLAKLATQEFTLIADGAPAAQQIAAGAKAMNIVAFPTHSLSVRNAGAPVKYKVIEPVLLSQQSILLPKGAQHPNAARLFADWFVGPEATALRCAQETVMASDPTGELGCLVTENPTFPNFDFPEESFNRYLDLLNIK